MAVDDHAPVTGARRSRCHKTSPWPAARASTRASTNNKSDKRSFYVRLTEAGHKRLALATLILDLVLIQPNHPNALTWGALRLFPLELPVIIAALLVLPAHLSLWPRRVLAVLHLGAQDALEIGTAAGPRLVPFVVWEK